MWGWWPHAARYTLEIFRYIVSAWQRTASQVCRGRWGTGKACHQQSHVRAASPEQYQKKNKRKEGQSYFCNSAGSEWASMLLRCCLAWSAVLQVIRMYLHSPSFSMVYPPEISGLEVSPCIFSLKPMLVRVHGNWILWTICGILLLAFCRLYVFPKNIACCLNYSNQMLSNIKLILGCLCPVSQPQRLSAEQMDSIN